MSAWLRLLGCASASFKARCTLVQSLSWLFLLLLAGCERGRVVTSSASRSSPFAFESAPALIAGDDRRDDYEYPDPTWVAAVRDSTVAMVMAGSLDFSDAPRVHVLGPTLQAKQGTCPDERFAAQ